MAKYRAFLMLGFVLTVAGCASSPSQNATPDVNAAASAQAAATPTTSQDREDRIKESDAVRKAMGY
jgi:hypothetical protein